MEVDKFFYSRKAEKVTVPSLEGEKKKKGKEKEIRTEVHTFKYFEKNLSRFFTLYLLIRLKKTYFASLRYYRH